MHCVSLLCGVNLSICICVAVFSQSIASMNISVGNVQQLVERLQRNVPYVSSRRLDMVERNVPL